jgi:hypothetical protein
MFRSTIDAAVVRLVAALQVLKEAPPNSLVHADALDVARRTIDVVIDVAERPNPWGHPPLIRFSQRRLE